MRFIWIIKVISEHLSPVGKTGILNMESGKELTQEKNDFDISIIRPQVHSEYYKLRRDGFTESRRMAYKKRTPDMHSNLCEDSR
jgi:hypothetical protein